MIMEFEHSDEKKNKCLVWLLGRAETADYYCKVKFPRVSWPKNLKIIAIEGS